jgi:hypothetical protein
LETSTKKDLLCSRVEEKENFTGISSSNSRIGDVVVVIRGCMHPLILRPVEGRHEIFGEIYVPGFMQGLATKMFKEVEIELV